MRVVVVGQGGREHALAWKLSQSPSVTKVFCMPGNAGTREVATNVTVPLQDFREVFRFCTNENIDLVVIGPEAPLVEGMADYLREKGFNVFGPSKAAAELEGSKIFCKQILRKAGISTAEYRIFDHIEDVKYYLNAHRGSCVVKADGLAAGKGAIVCKNVDEAREAAERILVHREFGSAGDKLIIEECLTGQETSVLAITDGKTIITFEQCQDHKRAYDNDEGPNTGGMGAYCPAPILTPEQLARVESEVFVPLLHALRSEKRPFQGILYAGLMLTRKGPMVLEFNVRFGDPECQPLLMRLRNDLGEVLMATAEGKLDTITLDWDPRPSVCVVMASGGYPGSYQKGEAIRGLDKAGRVEGVVVFHAGTKIDGDCVVTDGGRVLGVTAIGDDLAMAKARAYEAIKHIEFRGAMYRTDISDKAPAST